MYSIEVIQKQTGLSPEQIEHLATVFQEEIGKTIEDFSSLKERKDWRAAPQMAHRIKPGFVMFGLTGVTSILQKMMEPGATIDTSLVDELLLALSEADQTLKGEEQKAWN